VLVAVRYHEIALKGRNRPFFVAQLAKSLRRATSDLGRVHVHSLAGRLTVEAPDEVSWPVLRERVGSVLGVANYSPVESVPPTLDALREAALAAVAGRTFASFRVRARRSFKGFPHTSLEIEQQVGGALKLATGAKVDLDGADLTLRVEVLRDRILLSFDTLPGPGGFAVGSSGRVAVLLSGGIDSPVAAWRLMKRGCTAVFVHFHSFPLLDRTTIDKARALAAVLTRYQFSSRLLLVPFGPVQQAIVAAVPAPLRVVLYRRYMVRIAEALAARHKAKALVTGESLGQVASQTLDNMAVIDEAARGPVLRPLVGMDKDEITKQAEHIGTFAISTLPDQDCCQLFVPRSPATAARLPEVLAAEALLDTPALVAAALAGAELERFRFPGGRPPADGL